MTSIAHSRRGNRKEVAAPVEVTAQEQLRKVLFLESFEEESERIDSDGLNRRGARVVPPIDSARQNAALIPDPLQELVDFATLLDAEAMQSLKCGRSDGIECAFHCAFNLLGGIESRENEQRTLSYARKLLPL